MDINTIKPIIINTTIATICTIFIGWLIKKIEEFAPRILRIIKNKIKIKKDKKKRKSKERDFENRYRDYKQKFLDLQQNWKNYKGKKRLDIINEYFSVILKDEYKTSVVNEIFQEVIDFCKMMLSQSNFVSKQEIRYYSNFIENFKFKTINDIDKKL